MNVSNIVVEPKDSIKSRFTDNCCKKTAEYKLYLVEVHEVR
jgi:hypothetical protein